MKFWRIGRQYFNPPIFLPSKIKSFWKPPILNTFKFNLNYRSPKLFHEKFNQSIINSIMTFSDSFFVYNFFRTGFSISNFLFSFFIAFFIQIPRSLAEVQLGLRGRKLCFWRVLNCSIWPFNGGMVQGDQREKFS